MRALSIFAVVGSLFIAVTGCGGYPAPTERLATAEAAIRGAQELGATGLPRAALHLKLAQEHSAKAQQLMEDGYNETAELSLRQAQADAELAIALIKERAAAERAKTAQARLEQAEAAARSSAR
jgi:hypothetical protein